MSAIPETAWIYQQQVLNVIDDAVMRFLADDREDAAMKLAMLYYMPQETPSKPLQPKADQIIDILEPLINQRQDLSESGANYVIALVAAYILGRDAVIAAQENL